MSNNRVRKTILQEIRKVVGNNSTEDKVKDTMIFCIEDGERLDAKFKQDRYEHGNHTHERAFIFYPTTKFEFRGDGEIRHFSVGTILWRQEGREKRYCLFRGRTHPVGYYSFPAGHLEMGEVEEKAARREAYEETQLAVLEVDPNYYVKEIREECRRGADYHVWHCYVCECIGEPRLDSNEGDVIGWYTQDEIIKKLPLIKPAGYFFEKHFGKRPQNVRKK